MRDCREITIFCHGLTRTNTDKHEQLGSEHEAQEQIKTMKYHEKYLGSEKEIILLGIGFDPGKRNIANYLAATPAQVCWSTYT